MRFFILLLSLILLSVQLHSAQQMEHGTEYRIRAISAGSSFYLRVEAWEDDMTMRCTLKLTDFSLVAPAEKKHGQVTLTFAKADDTCKPLVRVPAGSGTGHYGEFQFQKGPGEVPYGVYNLKIQGYSPELQLRVGRKNIKLYRMNPLFH